MGITKMGPENQMPRKVEQCIDDDKLLEWGVGGSTT